MRNCDHSSEAQESQTVRMHPHRPEGHKEEEKVSDESKDKGLHTEYEIHEVFDYFFNLYLFRGHSLRLTLSFSGTP